MNANVPAFAGVAALIILTPGPDTAIVTKNALVSGRRAALGAALGVNTGLLIWTIASALGLAAVVRASSVAFDALKFAGAIYLIWLGIQALRGAGRGLGAIHPSSRGLTSRRGVARPRRGICSNLGYPKSRSSSRACSAVRGPGRLRPGPVAASGVAPSLDDGGVASGFALAASPGLECVATPGRRAGA